MRDNTLISSKGSRTYVGSGYYYPMILGRPAAVGCIASPLTACLSDIPPLQVLFTKRDNMYTYQDDMANASQEETLRPRFSENFMDKAERQGSMDAQLFKTQCANCGETLKKEFRNFINERVCENCYNAEQSGFERADLMGK